MSLTNEDLSAISQLLDTKFKTELKPLKDDIQSLKDDVCILKNDVSTLKKGQEELKINQEQLQANQEQLQANQAQLQANQAQLQANQAQLQTNQEQLRIEQQRLKASQDHICLIIENTIKPQIQLLAENYVPAAKQYLKNISKIETMQSDIDHLKMVATKHSEILHLHKLA